MIARLGVILGIDTSEFNKGIDSAGYQLGRLTQQIESYGKIAATAIAAAAIQSLHYADTIDDIATANEVALESVLKLQNALAMSGGHADNAGKLFSGFTKFVEEAAQGSVKAQRSFALAGISLNDLAKLSSEDLFKKALQGLSEIEDPLVRNAKAMELFGRAARGVDFKKINEEMINGAGVTEAQAKAVKAAADSWDELGQMARNTSLIFAESIGPVIKETLAYIKELNTSSGAFGKSLLVVFQTVAVVGSDVLFVFKGIYDEVVHTIDNAKILVTEGIDAAIKKNEEYATYREKEAKKLEDFQFRIMNIGVGSRSSEHPLRTDNAESEKLLETGRKIIDAEAEKKTILQDQINANITLLGFEKQRGDLIHEQIFSNDLLSKYKTEDLALQQKITEINKKANDEIAKNINGSKFLTDKIREKAQTEITLSEEISKNNKKRFQEQVEYQVYLANLARQAVGPDSEGLSRREQEDIRKNTEAISSAFILQSRNQKRLAALSNEKLASENRYLDLLPRQQLYLSEQFDLAAKIAEYRIQAGRAFVDPAVIDDFARSMDELGQKTIQLKLDAIDTQRTWEFGWDTAFNSFIDNAENAALKAKSVFETITSNMNSALANFVKTGKLNFADFAKSVIQQLILIQLQAQASSMLSMAFKAMGIGSGVGSTSSYTGYDGGSGALMASAAGGPLNSNQASIVGENGPELFIPKTAGVVIPNHMTGQVGSTTTNVTNNYINAIDTKSFEQRLLQSSTAVWAANSYATKSLPVGMGRS
jgi:lambda family phage tail tape measure protein